MADLDFDAFALVPKGHAFEDFHEGQVFEHHRGRTLNEGDNSLFRDRRAALRNGRLVFGQRRIRKLYVKLSRLSLLSNDVTNTRPARVSAWRLPSLWTTTIRGRVARRRSFVPRLSQLNIMRVQQRRSVNRRAHVPTMR